MRHKTTAWVLLGLIAAQGMLAHAAPPGSPKTAATLPLLEQAYADFNDAYGAGSQALLDQVRRIGASAPGVSAAAPPGAS